MIPDASLVVELLVNGPLAPSIRHFLRTGDRVWFAPHLLDIEVASALRGLATARRIDSFGVQRALERLDQLPAERYPHTPLLLCTCDGKLARGTRPESRCSPDPAFQG